MHGQHEMRADHQHAPIEHRLPLLDHRPVRDSVPPSLPIILCRRYSSPHAHLHLLSSLPFVRTGSHYLTENLLCLMSNASKYSDRGATIDVRLELVDADADPDKPLPAAAAAAVAATVLNASNKSASARSALPGLDLDASVNGRPAKRKMVLVTVEDNGIGITEENQRKLFQPFKQAQRSAGGTGLGLFSLAKRIEALEGTCGVRNRLDGKQGSAFWFTFPYRPDVAAWEEYEEMLSGKRKGSSSGNPTQRSGGNGTPGRTLPQLRILLTDDSPAILKVTTRFLEKAGHVVETADNGNQSLERLKVARDDFDLLITDLQVLRARFLICTHRDLPEYVSTHATFYTSSVPHHTHTRCL